MVGCSFDAFVRILILAGIVANCTAGEQQELCVLAYRFSNQVILGNVEPDLRPQGDCIGSSQVCIAKEVNCLGDATAAITSTAIDRIKFSGCRSVSTNPARTGIES
jgi:hypothetical protein